MRYFIAFFLGGIVAVGGLVIAQRQGLIPQQIQIPELQQAAWPGAKATATGKLRVASFNVRAFGETKAVDPIVMHRIAETIRRYDVVAIQKIRTQRHDLLPQLMDIVNAEGVQYAYVLGPRLGENSAAEQYAFVFNTQSLALEKAYTIEDPDNLLQSEPLVGWFRALGVPPEEALTFTLVNVHIHPNEVDFELQVLDDVFRRVQEDSRMEDDVILLGNFNAAPEKVLNKTGLTSCLAAIQGDTTNTLRTATHDNLFFPQAATVEFTGRSGVDDLVKRLNITTAEAQQISDHFPVWAEFSGFEGGTDLDRVLISQGETNPVK